MEPTGYNYFQQIEILQKENKLLKEEVTQLRKELSATGTEGTKNVQIEVLEENHKKAKAELRQSKERLKGIFENLRIREAQLDAFFANSPAILNLVDENLCYIYTDKLTPTYYGLTRETIKGKCVQDLSPDFFEQTGNVMRHVLETGESIIDALFESPVPGRKGEIAYWRTSFFRVPLENEKWGVGVISAEITDMKQSEVKLRESEKRFRMLADNISQFAWIANSEGKVEWFNKRWFDYTGTTVEEMQGKGRLKVHHPDFADRVLQSYEHAIISGEAWENIYPLKDKNGRYRWFLARALPIWDENGKITLWFGTNTDIHEQKLAEEALQRSETILKQAETMANLGAWEIEMVHTDDISKNPLIWSDQVYRIFGYAPGSVSVTSKLFYDHVHIEERHKIRETVIKAINEKNTYSIEHRIKRADGAERIVVEHAEITYNEHERPARIIGAIQDITERKLAEKKLIQALAEAEEGRNTLAAIERELKERNEELSRIIYTFSHDLKSPIVTIKMFALYLREDIISQNKEAQDKDLGYIENAADRIGKLLEELLELSRIGRKEEPVSEIMLEGLIQSVIDLLAGRIRERNVIVQNTAPPVMIHGYKQGLFQVYQNLLDNALKFMGPQPKPLVEIGAFIDKERNNEVVLFVRDNGSGIDQQFEHKVFGLFEKLDPGSEGTGIGLALVKRIIEVHEGHIWFSSVKGKGTTFYFTLGQVKLLS